MTQSGRNLMSCLRSLTLKLPAPSSWRSIRSISQVAAATTAASVATAGLFSFSPFYRVPEAKAALRATDPSIEPLVKRPSLVFNFLADVVEKTAPAVVRIEIPIYNRFFSEPIGISAGSGFLITADGLILTNAHVVGNARTCKVILSDNQELEGTVEAIDENTDLATVKISGKNLPVIPLGSSGASRAGEFVVALGSPLHLTNSISHGIISSVNRRLDNLTGGQVSSMPYLQTDAAINIGNSGGPLVNLEGEAIGVNSLKLAEGIAFAIPMDYVKQFLVKVNERKMAIRKAPPQPSETPNAFRRGFIGLTMLQLNQRIVDQIRSTNPDFPNVSQGILVMKIVAGSPAQQSGLQPNDVIMKVNGKDVSKDANIFFNAISGGREIVLEIKRGPKDLRVSLQPQEHNVLVFSAER